MPAKNVTSSSDSHIARFEVITGVLLTFKFCLNMEPYLLVNSYRIFGKAWCLHLPDPSSPMERGQMYLQMDKKYRRSLAELWQWYENGKCSVCSAGFTARDSDEKLNFVTFWFLRVWRQTSLWSRHALYVCVCVWHLYSLSTFKLIFMKFGKHDTPQVTKIMQVLIYYNQQYKMEEFPAISYNWWTSANRI
jgi:hypothetical protein